MKKRGGLQAKLGIYGWIVCSLGALFYCYEYMLRIEPSVMVPQLMRFYGIDAASLGVLTAMFYYAYTPLQLFVGILTDYFGPKRVLVVAISICVLGTILFVITKEIYVAAIGRFLVGIGAAFAFVGVLKLAAIWLPENRFALFTGLAVALGMIGAMFGDIEMTWAVKKIGWHAVILDSAIFGAILVPMFILFIKRKVGKVSRQAIRLKSFKEGFIGLGKMLINPTILKTGVVGCMLYLSLSVFGEMWGDQFVKASLTDSSLVAAIVNSCVFLGWLVGSPVNGWLSDKIKSRRKPLIYGCIISFIIFSGILIWPPSNPYILGFLLFLFGLISSVEVLCFAIARDISAIKYTAMAVAVVNFLIMLGGVIFQPFVAWLLDLFWSGKIYQGEPYYSLNDYRKALTVIPFMLIIGGIISLFMKETYRAKKSYR